MIILSITVVTFSLLVILVITRNTKLKNSQSCYKVSMALSDIIVAVIILPSTIYNMWYYVYNSEYSVVNQDQINERYRFMKKSSSTYLKFFTALIYCTALISVYSIVFAAIDRLIVIIYPLFYRSHNMIKISKYICIFIWMFVFSLMFYKMFYTFSDNCLYYYLASIPSTCMDDIFSFVIGLIIFGTFLLLFLSILTVFLLRKNNLKTKIIRSNARQKKSLQN